MRNFADDLWCSKHEASKLLGISIFTLRDWRRSGRLIEGIHWIRYGKTSLRYNRALLEDYIATRPDPKRHQIAIDNYLSNVPSNQPRKAGRKTKTLATFD